MRRLAWVLPAAFGFCSLSGHALAEPLVDLTGRVALLDGAVPGGVRLTLGIDIDRDGKLNSFELVQASVADDGSYAASYEPETDPTKYGLDDLKFAKFIATLVADYEARGFDALLDDGPLPVIVRFEREGYGTIVKRFTTLTDLPSLDVVLAPLAKVACDGADCMATDGSVHVGGFPGGTGIERAYARRYDPRLDQARFPGNFTDSSNNLLISSGFTEVDLRDASGDHVSKLTSPVSVRFQTDSTSWGSLRDLSPESSRIEVPMYSFDEARGEWVTEAQGELQGADGTSIDEADFPSIQDGSYPDAVFVAFQTTHFSTFNCDAPNSRRGCVKGRLVTLEGDAVAGAQVSVQGVSYTGSAGTVYTGSDGTFATDLMKSEVAGEDADGNGKRGETFQAKLSVTGALGVYVGEPFDTPKDQGTVGGPKSCRPADCDCLDLGDVPGDFELPRACEISVHVTFSGKNAGKRSGPLDAGDALAGANVTAEMSDGPQLPGDDALCAGKPCGSGKADADGSVSFIVPVVGDSPKIQVHTDLTVSSNGGDTDYYNGAVTITGCSRDHDTLKGIEVEANHAALGDLGDFIGSLGAGPGAPPSDNPLGIPDHAVPSLSTPKGCACQAPRGGIGDVAGAAFGAGLVGLVLARRRRRG
ncbi:MAG TPA: hypothetical protein VGQ57_17885 [Polyangiaceae bacterium]|jgi:hypothetical protein|nr:hypothetical protein [Polyangiaceae bacterium]